MKLDLQIQETVAHLITNKYADLPRAAVEALAVEVFSTKWFSEGRLRQMLGFSSRMQVHAFLKVHGFHLHYSLEGVEQDREISRELEEEIAVNPRLA